VVQNALEKLNGDIGIQIARVEEISQNLNIKHYIVYTIGFVVKPCIIIGLEYLELFHRIYCC
jgi:hypothetical protein